MLNYSLCDYNDAYILDKGTITVPNTAASDANANNANKKVIFKNRAPFINCINKINNKQVDNAKDVDVVMPMYNGNIVNFNGANATDSFNFKVIFNLNG